MGAKTVAWAHDSLCATDGATPVIVESATPPDQFGWHTASDAEFAAYETYWDEWYANNDSERADG